jgi:hypothetical protein
MDDKQTASDIERPSEHGRATMNLFNTLWLPRKCLAREHFSRAPPKFASVSHFTDLPSVLMKRLLAIWLIK